MTTALSGLRKALARTASGGIVTVAEMQTDDLISQMTDEQKADLAAKLTPQASEEAASEETEVEVPESEGEPGAEDEAEAEAEPEPAAASANDRVKAVAAAVASDENCKGKADLALQMLADDDFAGLSASGLIKLLGKATGTQSNAAADPEAAARAEMQAAIRAAGNSNIDPSNGGSGSNASGAEGNAAWNNVLAKMNKQAA